MTIVDTFGLIKRKQFLRLVYLADNNMKPDIALCYHAHNNLQQALGNAEALVEMNLNRDLCLDACVFGMGRGAGNLNLEVFAEYMNDNYETHYRIEPMLEIMDEYLNEIYQNRFWGYSLPLYLSASTGTHPNYAIYLAEKDTLTVKAFNELLQLIPPEDKARFSKEKAEKYYRAYQTRAIDDQKAIAALTEAVKGRSVLLLAPGRSLLDCYETVQKTIEEKQPVIFAVNFNGGAFHPDYIFSSNMRRFSKISFDSGVKTITTSNMDGCEHSDYVVNFSSYASRQDDVIDNSGLMALRLLAAMGVKEVLIAGMDGYSEHGTSDYIDRTLEYAFESGAAKRNRMIAAELADIRRQIDLCFITPTHYSKALTANFINDIK
jgi:4-hydroxy 2-oxovalerate aldolase